MFDFSTCKLYKKEKCDLQFIEYMIISYCQLPYQSYSFLSDSVDNGELYYMEVE